MPTTGFIANTLGINPSRHGLTITQSQHQTQSIQARLREQLEQLQLQSPNVEDELTKVLNDAMNRIEELETRLATEKKECQNHIKAAYKGYHTEFESILNEFGQTMADLRQTRYEKEELEKVVKEYRIDTQAVADLHQTKDEKENLQQMFTKYQDPIQQRERSRPLELQRKEVQDKLSHMDAQANSDVIISIDEILMKLDMASEENVKLRNVLHVNNQLLEQKLQQFERLIGENKRLKREIRRLSRRLSLREDQCDDLQSLYEYEDKATPQFARQRLYGHQPLQSQLQHMCELQSPGLLPLPPKGTPPSTTGVGAFGMGRAMGSGHNMTPLRTSDPSVSSSPSYVGRGAANYDTIPPRAMDRVNPMVVTGYTNSPIPQAIRPVQQPLRASDNQFHPHGFPPPSSQSGFSRDSGHARPSPPTATVGGGGLYNLDGPGVGVPPQQIAPIRAVDPSMVPWKNPPNQLNNLNQPPPQGDKYIAPGEVFNEAPASMGCPLCGKFDFKTQNDLELHCAQCI